MGDIWVKKTISVRLSTYERWQQLKDHEGLTHDEFIEACVAGWHILHKNAYVWTRKRALKQKTS